MNEQSNKKQKTRDSDSSNPLHTTKLDRDCDVILAILESQDQTHAAQLLDTTVPQLDNHLQERNTNFSQIKYFLTNLIPQKDYLYHCRHVLIQAMQDPRISARFYSHACIVVTLSLALTHIEASTKLGIPYQDLLNYLTKYNISLQKVPSTSTLFSSEENASWRSLSNSNFNSLNISPYFFTGTIYAEDEARTTPPSSP